jgi:recombination protein RecA
MGALSRRLEILDGPLIRRGLDGFQNKSNIELQPCGVAELDALLCGGFPRGSLVELCGAASSGRTSLAYSLLAQATGQQETCAFVDVSDSLDPISLAAAGVDLSRLLWIRCGEHEGQKRDPKVANYFADPKNEPSGALKPAGKKASHINNWRHPRESMIGLDRAIPSVLGKQSAPQKPGQIHVVARCAGEQVERDRELPRRGVRAARSLPAILETPKMRFTATYKKGNGKPWKRLEQALKSTDLLLHGGGWGVVIVDLGGISWADARRINLSTWFRFRRAIESTQTILLLLGEESYARSCASLVLRCERIGDKWNRAAANVSGGASTLEGFEVQGEVSRSRVMSQPADLVRWQTHTT